MNVLIACEESQRVCGAFRAKGHNAFSCDIIDCSGGHPEWHIKRDVLPLLNGRCKFITCDGELHTILDKWDLIIARLAQGFVTAVKGGCIGGLKNTGQIREKNKKKQLNFL